MLPAAGMPPGRHGTHRTTKVAPHAPWEFELFACSGIGCVESLSLSGGTGALPLHDCVEPCLILEGSCFVDRLRRAVAHVFGDRFLTLVCFIPCDPS